MAKDPRENMTKEEIQAYMKKEEEDLESRLSKFSVENKKNEGPYLADEEKDQEEETFTLDFETNNVYQLKDNPKKKVAENPEQKRTVKEVSQKEELPEQTSTDQKEEAQEDDGFELKQEYGDLIQERFISNAIADLIASFNELENDIVDAFEKNTVHSMAVSESILEKSLEDTRNKKMALRASISGGKVHYEKIPDWVKSYVEEYIRKSLDSLISLTK